MTIIVFLIDTSGSMNQKTFIGARPTLLDVAKGAVESFVKVRWGAVATYSFIPCLFLCLVPEIVTLFFLYA